MDPCRSAHTRFETGIVTDASRSTSSGPLVGSSGASSPPAAAGALPLCARTSAPLPRVARGSVEGTAQGVSNRPLDLITLATSYANLGRHAEALKLCAETLAREGATVVVANRKVANGEDTVVRITNQGGRAVFCQTDVSVEVDCKRAVQTAVERFGKLDVLINNAGIGAPAVPLEDLALEQWKAVVDVNLTGAFVCTQEAFKSMKKQTPRGGRIINNGSIAAHAPRPYTPVLCSSR